MSDLFQNLPRNRSKLEVWKERHGVVTSNRVMDMGQWFACTAEDSYFGDDEEGACRELALHEKLPFLESVTQAEMEGRK